MATDCAVDPKVKYADLLKPANKRVIQESIPLKTVEYSNGIPRISWTEEEVDKMNVIEGLQFAVIVGKPIQLDMAIINRTRLSYAKVKVQLDLTVKLPNYVELEVINRRTQINKVQKVDELEDGEVPADTPDDLNNDKHEHHKEVIRQEHKELDFSEGTIDKKLPVENITTNALMGREDPQYIKVSYNKNNTDMPQAHTETPGKTNWRNKGVEKDNHNSSHEVIQEGMSNVEDSQSTPAIEIENKKDVMIVKHQDDEVSHELVVPLQIDTSCIRDFQGLQEGTSPDTGYGGRGQHRGQVEDFEEADNQTNMTQALIDAGLPDTSTTRGRNKDYEEFAICVNSCDLVDINFKGPFTWWNGRADRDYIFKRLDMLLFNQACMSLNGLVEVEHLARTRSDHAPLLLTSGGGGGVNPLTLEDLSSFSNSGQGQSSYIRRPFNFLKFWVEAADFQEVVKAHWLATDCYAPPPPGPQGYPPPGQPEPVGYYGEAPPPPGPPSYQGYFNDQYPPPDHIHHDQPADHDSSGCCSFLKGWVSAWSTLDCSYPMPMGYFTETVIGAYNCFD
ncbi:hypothetical protein KY289_025717 [Solanum tuberosum]|nr:hypothetical protein KY289_025717 [Solanum tuberosum]